MKLVIVYHPPHFASQLQAFVFAFTIYLESIVLSTEPLLITCGFSLHVVDPCDAEATEFPDTVESMVLQQHLNVPTHEQDHTLDLVSTRHCDSIIFQVYSEN